VVIGVPVLAQDTALPAWVGAPSTLPLGKLGENNCTFQLPANAQWDVHPDAGCWERPGRDGWTRQQFQNVHAPALTACGGGPADLTGIRVCRAGSAGQLPPCGALAGPLNCETCTLNTTCH